MAKKAEQGRRRGAPGPGVVSAAKRGGPGRGFWIGLGAVVVLGVALLSWQAMKGSAPVSRIDPTLPRLKAEGYLLGSPSAPVEVTEFADFECPSCGQFATLTEPDVRSRLVNTGQIRIRFMDFPLDIHRNTLDAHIAASCANEQGKFWPMHDAIFAAQDRWNGEATSRPRGPLSDIAKGIGLDMTKYGACMDSDKYKANIQANLEEGSRRGVSQTPTFIIGDKIYPGALPFDAFRKAVEEAGKGAPPAAPGTPAKAP